VIRERLDGHERPPFALRRVTVGFAERAADDTVEILIGRADAALVAARRYADA
jgi:hypothetical protein